MPKLPRITAKEAEKLLLNAGFIEIRSKGSHRIYFRENVRVVIPFHSGKILHPKTVQQVFTAIESFELERTEEEINQDEEDI
ncbi:type II toxin-antitoxin system HicA family toxin [Cuspidothrix issatschenkoi LEGE 03284]|uniref:type II toxin-antitoxin system HicA family toxin n=1 Tax=Cuspidothrix issatschenkoi TaxID=230752 RepID=UPI00187E1C66|nr:type II toxin-antitoxin system HicA family toxin [Cuspidothrix issatschenkoi]MBE9232353.1 type II toxin-antitoxin system HicA family toxin [Cuspidothrix issatschenkoi LEGE 03284]